jgi:hypothetical protein
MSRKIIRTALVLAAALTVTAVMFAAPLPANAANNHLKETNGAYRVGAPSLTNYDPVVETVDGRNLNIIIQSGDDVKIKFSTDTSKCVAGANNGTDVVIHPCDGTGIVWTMIGDGFGHLFFFNKKFSLYLAGANNGTQFKLRGNPSPGWYERFDITG